tara:strand:- start:5578 stop:5718 length:141 start_codon:yes stop_codon:yes gene_type:complete
MTDIEEYLKQLNDQEILALEQAKKILGDSFNIKKSIGYNIWLKNKN